MYQLILVLFLVVWKSFCSAEPYHFSNTKDSAKNSSSRWSASKSSLKSSDNNIAYKGGCKKIPTVGGNVNLRCSTYSGCQAKCFQDHQFPNGMTQLFVPCRDGEWQIEGTEWTTIPACEPVCVPPCLNNGICISPNQCHCPENYSGPQCQFHNTPCMQYPPVPINSKRMCNSKTCVISCMDGHQFPDGSQVANLVCSNGQWSSARSDWVSIPDCEPICNPPCENGGNCLSFNVCQCPQNFRGSQCQYDSEVCSSKKLKFNGGYNCTGNSDGFYCTLSCPDGIQFEFTPHSVYTCKYENGAFLPSPIPQCVYGSFIPVIVAGDSEIINIQKGGRINMFEVTKPVPGVCFTWGGSHFKTFDGQVFSFDSSCPHMLLRDSTDKTFSVIVQSSEDCESNRKNCYRIVTIYLQDKKYLLKKTDEGLPVFATLKKQYPLPVRLAGIRVEMLAHYFLVKIDSVGVTIKWDGEQFIQVEVQENMWNRTEGLCGRIDGDVENDLTTKTGKIPKNIVTLATSWQIDDIEEKCKKEPKEEHTCPDTSTKGSLGREALKFCQKLLSDDRFKSCRKFLDVRLLLEVCRWDYCNCKGKPDECACQTLNVYVRECSFKGVTSLADWRDEQFCPMKCEDDKVYMSCGPIEGQEMCADVTERGKDDKCEEGCYCPTGTVLHNSKCITKDKCPCRLRGKEFSPRSTIPKDCNTCTCVDGKWICTQVNCGARCSALGDPHYITFDGKRYDFMGRCSYYLVKNDNFSVEAENVPCSGAVSEAMNLPSSILSGLPSCTKTVTIRINGQVITLKQNHELIVNGVEVFKIPFEIGGAVMRIVSSIFLLVELPGKVEIWWDGQTRVYIDMSATFKGKTEGLCGTFNHNQNDDFLTPEGDVEKSPEAFANKWKTSEKCNNVPPKISDHPCVTNVQNKAKAEDHCKIIKSKIFESCHWYVDPEPFYQDCLYDVCSCDNRLSKCLCPMIAAYAQECVRKGSTKDVEWRNEVRECGVQCPTGQTYRTCGDTCSRTCAEIAANRPCDRACTEGCNCPEGEALDEYNECVPIGRCSCQHEGLQFRSGYVEVRPATKGQQLCTCLNARWDCHPATVEEAKKYPKASDLKTKCDPKKNMEFTTCEPSLPTTCKNMHSLDLVSSAECHPGCQCKDGYVLDTHGDVCVLPTDCPCHHGGRSYVDGNVVQNDCNTCTCNSGKWTCTERQCAAECSSWGDSHFKTFDGKYYDYQGQCDYVLTKGALAKRESFSVFIENVPCGSLGVSCSKSITVEVGQGEELEKVILAHEKPIPEESNGKRLKIRQKGLVVIVEAPELGLLVYWDKSTTVYVRLEPKWKDKVKGLCGNYNNDETDDFQTPSGGIAEASVEFFGDSWKLQSYCPKAVEITDSCKERPDRKIWAVKKCGILKSSLFAPCHSEVSVDNYMDRCVFDTCACDQGGDCECLCSALAAYAHECNNKGVPIKWRSQKLCPMQCDERCSVYSPCISTCPVETCDNFLTKTKLTKSCTEHPCIEGCQTKPCPSDHVYFNSSYLECAPKATCKPTCLTINGVTYLEGEIMEKDECHSCYCSRGEKKCNGQLCISAAIPLMVNQTDPAPNEEILKCSNGWTNWINQDKGGDKKLNDIEPLPDTIMLSKLSDNVHCSKSQMVDIECRTVENHLDPKVTGLDVECSLEKGLVCRSEKEENPCEDFEIRVKCLCEKSESCQLNSVEEHPTNCQLFYTCASSTNGNEMVERSCNPNTLFNPISKVCDWPDKVIALKPQCAVLTPVNTFSTSTDSSICPSGQIFDECAIDCDNMCLYYNFIVKRNGLCINYEDCIGGCVTHPKPAACPEGMLRSNNETCVKKHDCMCVSDDGKPVKPGEKKQFGCKWCQCIDNFYFCDDTNCVTVEPTTAEVPTVTTISPLDKTTISIKATITPPVDCLENNYVNLIKDYLNDEDVTFRASSESIEFPAESARFKDKKGVWKPEMSDGNQYLEVDLGKHEPVYGTILKGNPLKDEYVTSYKVSYSADGIAFSFIKDKNGNEQVLRGSVNNKKNAKKFFDVPIEAKILRIHPTNWHKQIALKVDFIGCSDDLSTTEVPSTTTISPTLTSKPPIPVCTDEMGLNEGFMADQQVLVSSSINPEHDRRGLKLNGKSYWQPSVNSPMEWVQFDFLALRNLTGFVSKGGVKGWITSFTVSFSPDGKSWSSIMDENKKIRVFSGNYDGSSEVYNYFDMPVQTRYLKVISATWNDIVQLRIEILGCYESYPPVVLTTSTQAPSTVISPMGCENCPGAPSAEMELGACRCENGLLYNGESCVPKSQCACMVGHLSYEVGSVFEKEDCSQCICKLGGVEHCTPKECEKCEEGLRRVVTSTCGCVCQPCPHEQVLCPTDNICINSSSWCNGIADCSDDELNCISPGRNETTTNDVTTIEKHCEKPKCANSYKLKIKKLSKMELLHSNLSPMFSSSTKKSSSKTKGKYKGYKGNYVKGNALKQSFATSETMQKQVKENEKEVEKVETVCPQFVCESTRKPPGFLNHTTEINRCPPIVCPAGYNPVYDLRDIKSKEITCPRYECKPPYVPDSVCNVTGRTFTTFDETEYKYDICESAIARDLENSKWMILLKKHCDKTCSRILIIFYEDEVFILNPDLTIEYNGYKYTADQLKKISSKSNSFTVSKLGETILFISDTYGFWIIWDKGTDVKLGVAEKLLYKVDGLCGYFNHKKRDDKRKPNGKIAKTTIEFGDSWEAQVEKPAICETKACPIHVQNDAWQMCQKVKEGVLSLCKTAVDVDSFISRCLETTCNCLQQTNSDKNVCKCESLQSFVVDCLTANPDLELSDWRMQQDCPVSCQSPLRHYDCYKRRCEPTCESLSDSDSCPSVSNVCFPGCYCPSGYVKRGNECVLPTACRDCQCKLLPSLQYVSYDGNNVTVGGDCDYVMTRDTERKFEIINSIRPCEKNVEKSCVAKVTMKYKDFELEITKDGNSKLKLTPSLDQLKEKNIAVKEDVNNNIDLLLEEEQVEVSILFPSLSVSVKAPSIKYGGKLEGLCGNCDGNVENDMIMSNGTLAENEKDFEISWLRDDHKSKEECLNKIEGKTCKPLPPDSDPCLLILSDDVFGKCHPLVDPTLYVDWCRKSICDDDRPESSCESIATYAKECAASGSCIDWRRDFCPQTTTRCPEGFEYRVCAPDCRRTCDDIRNGRENCTGNEQQIDGCFCPDGKVLDGNKCIEEDKCVVCDEEGHRPGDEWRVDNCTSCKCTGRSVKCETKSCPSLETVCEKGFDAVKVKGEGGECCQKYICVSNTRQHDCPPPEPLACANDQIMKIVTNSEGCEQFTCQCKPITDCERIVNEPKETLPPGVEMIVNTSGCCPVAQKVCKVENCPKPPSCPKYHEIEKKYNGSDDCCPNYECRPPLDKCIVDLEYKEGENGGGETKRNKYEKIQLLKEINDMWSDGPCRKCKCTYNSWKKATSDCTLVECPSIKSSPDFADYLLEEKIVEGECCPIFARKACKHENGTVYRSGEKWPVHPGDFCKTFECVESEGKVSKIQSTTSCDEKCDLGFEYKTPGVDEERCCGSCVPVACVVDGTVKQIEETWTSDDFCVKFTCLNLNGSVQTQSVSVNCSKVSNEIEEEFVYELEKIDDECCPKLVIKGCKVEGKEYKIGDSWSSPDGDKCKSYTCTVNKFGEITKQEKLESCQKNCSKGWEYKESNSSCCGFCEQVACVINDTVKYPKEMWKSEDECTTFTCEKYEEAMTISMSQDTCPNVENCPEKYIYTKNCCRYCNQTAMASSNVLCISQSIGLKKTLGLVKTTHHPHGKCYNKKEINNFTECIGSCHSSTIFNSNTGLHDSQCSCCQAIKYDQIIVEMECEDGHKYEKAVAVPSECGCVGCAALGGGREKRSVLDRKTGTIFDHFYFN